MDYRWWRFIHIVGAFGFMMTHGVSIAVAFKLRRERDRARIRDLLSFSGSTVTTMYISLALLVGGGIGAGLELGSWGQRWIWISVGLLAATIVLMMVLARPYYKGIAEATELRPSGVPRVSDEDLALRLMSQRPMIAAGIGFLSLIAIVWLMVFRPR